MGIYLQAIGAKYGRPGLISSSSTIWTGISQVGHGNWV